MSVEENKALARRIFEELINRRNLAAIDELLVADFVDHSAWENLAPGSAGTRAALERMYATFSELQVHVDDVIADGDRVATRETWTAKAPGSDRQISGTTMHHFVIKDGKFTEEWSEGWGWMDQDASS